MPNNKMLIDASHPEETRVVVLRGNRIEEFDFESASKKPLRGNIYLAKVTRVEPSLQAAFVEYGGNRHGFLAFSEIHPDYYQIPVADRQALLEEEALARRDEEEEEERASRPQHRRSRRFRRNGERGAQRAMQADDVIAAEAPQPDFGEDTPSGGGDFGAPTEEGQAAALAAPGDAAPNASPAEEGTAPSWTAPAESQGGDRSEVPGEIQGQNDRITATAGGEAAADPYVETTASAATPAPAAQAVQAPEDLAERAHESELGQEEPRALTDESPAGEADLSNVSDETEEADEAEEEEEVVEQIGGDEIEELERPIRRPRRQYKIQEVIKRRQVLLVQVVKEERGNKGAALTTYLSLAGRYSVLMPNTARGGGISRKITDNEDRKRLREIAGALDVPEGMGVILRTAGAARGKEEVQRDFEYLLRMWESVRELTLRSMAPALVYEEGSLIKRSIRDLYGKEIDEVIVAGAEGYKEARDFMGMLMPSHVGNVREWKEPQAIFAKYGVEQQLDSMFSNVVTLKSGGYIVVNQTEALVAIDVNSGRSTREHNIEDTALRTNLEAADEIARQLRLRDLAGLIVVDFIDMEEHRNNRAVERRMKEALKNDRARIQVGRISHFGLLEMSRQRMRTGVLEGSSIPCPHCMGAGTVRSTASIALHVLRLVEDALIRNNQFNLTVRTRTEVALYILNQKRSHLRDLEERFGVMVTVAADDSLTGANHHVLERGDPVVAAAPAVARPPQIRVDTIAPVYEDEEAAGSDDGAENEEEEGEEETASEGGATETERADPRRRKRRRRRGGRGREPSGIEADAPQPADDALAAIARLADAPAMRGAEENPMTAMGQAVRHEPGQERAGQQASSAAGETALQDDVGADHRYRHNGRRRRGGQDREGGFAPRNDQGETAASQNGVWVRTLDPDLDATAADAPHANAPADAPAPSPVGFWTSAAADPAPPPSAAFAAQTPSDLASSAIAPLAPAPAPLSAEPPASAIPADEPKLTADTSPADTAPADTSPAEKPAPEKRATDQLPEAPPPAEKKGGWWQRARNAMGGR